MATREKKIRVLWLSDSPTVNTGFGVVSRNLIDNLCRIMGDNIEIVVIGINILSSQPIQYNKQTIIIDGRIAENNSEDSFCREAFLDFLKNDPAGYDGIFILQDFGIIHPIINRIKKIKESKLKLNKKNFGSILYVPVDGYVNKKYLRDIDFFDSVITYTEYGKAEIVSKAPDIKTKIKILPHGCNTNHFFNIPDVDISEFRNVFFGENAKKIIFINCNRNQPRKAIHDTILSFIEAKRTWVFEREPFLYLHMGRRDPMGLNLDLLLEQTDLVEGVDYKIAPDSYWTDKWGVDTEVLNKIYNSCDVYITTTLGEGWGLSVTEAMAVKLPVICPSHTSLGEISDWGNRAYVLSGSRMTTITSDSVFRESVDIVETAQTIWTVAGCVIHNDIGLHEKVNSAYRYVKTLTWKSISNKLLEYFKKSF